MTKAVALYSGGLDSTLAILTVMKQGVEVTAITFLNHFGCDISDRSSCSKDPFAASVKFGFKVKLAHLSDKFLEIVKNPRYGYGRNMNPCIDCRILMLKEAKDFMNLSGADFIITGEVLGQRPMSQRKECFPMIDRAARLKGFVLRPLSARLLPPTVPEEKGLVKRDLLYDLNGRSRKPQMALAHEFELTEYPAPAGGCLLTEPIYAFKLRDLLMHTSNPEYTDINLLRIGRHFRFSPDCKIIIGRDKDENETIRSMAGTDDYLFKVEGTGSPLTVLRGKVTDSALMCAASLCARYSDAKYFPEVDVTAMINNERFNLKVNPATNEMIATYRIEKKKLFFAGSGL